MLKDYYSSTLSPKLKRAYRCFDLAFREMTEHVQIADVTDAEFVAALNAYQREHPMVYWVNFHSGMPYYNMGEYILLEPPYLYKDETKEIDAAFKKACSEIPSYPHNPRMQVMAIVKWMSKLRYVNTKAEHEHNVVGPLLYGEGVCEAFSQLFQAFCDHFKVDCMVALGSVIGEIDGHAWNVIGYGGKRYNVDMTQAIAIAQKFGLEMYNVMVPDYIIDNYVSLDKPYCGVLADNPYFLEEKAFTNEQELSRMLVRYSKLHKPFCLLDASIKPLNVESLFDRIDIGQCTSMSYVGRLYKFTC